MAAMVISLLLARKEVARTLFVNRQFVGFIRFLICVQRHLLEKARVVPPQRLRLGSIVYGMVELVHTT